MIAQMNESNISPFVKKKINKHCKDHKLNLHKLQ